MSKFRIPVQPLDWQVRIWSYHSTPFVDEPRRVSVSQIVKTDINVSTATKTDDRPCDYCHKPIPVDKRADAKYCSEVCRKARWRDDQKLTMQIDYLMSQLDNLQKHSPERFNAILLRYRNVPHLSPTTDTSVSIATKTDKRLSSGRDD